MLNIKKQRRPCE